jgi:hypothetical protein
MKANALEKRRSSIYRLIENAVVKLEPFHFAIQKIQISNRETRPQFPSFFRAPNDRTFFSYDIFRRFLPST